MLRRRESCLRRIAIALIAVVVTTAAAATAADAEFPYSTSGGDKRDFTTLRTGKGQVPQDLPIREENVWKFSASPEENNFPVNLDPRELFGIRGSHVADADASRDTAWTVTTGRPDVKIAVLDSGFKWNSGENADLRFKTWLNRGELPPPNHAGPDLVGGVSCGSYADAHDANGDNIFNLLDYACDSRLRKDMPRNVNANLLDPQDVLIAFSDGRDDDGNGFADDMVGWDFLDDDNDPYDDVQYGHGTGEAEGSSAEANNNAQWIGTCPNCMAMHMRVGDSFIADDNRFGQAAIYAVDNGALVIQEALGTLNNTQLGQRAVDYAYDHGVLVAASAADEAAQHHNYPSSHEHTLIMNSVTKYLAEGGDTPFGRFEGPLQVPRSYLTFNGCTNFSSKIGLAIPSTSCSSDAVGVGSGMAGLVYSAALNGVDQGKLKPHPTCKRVDGSPCPLSANEVRQVMASGAFAGQTQPDDVNFNQGPLGPQPEPACSPSPAPGCTDPNVALQQQVNGNRPIVSPPDSRSYPARLGHDQFYGWGRINTFRAVKRAADGHVAPEVEITSPEWFAQVDPTKPTAALEAQVWARGSSYSCKVYVAPGSYPNNRLSTDSQPGDFTQVPSPVCNGQPRTERIDGTVAALDLNALKDRFPPDAGDFRGPETGEGAGQTSNGRPNSEPYGFTVRVVAESTALNPGVAASGEDRRNLYLHRDQDMLDGFPKQLPSDGESSPALADLDGDNRNELVFGTADGWVHAMRPDGSELSGWPVRTDPLPLHAGGRAFASNEVGSGASHGAVLSSPAVADLDRDGRYEVVVADFEGKIYAWSAAGKLAWKRATEEPFSGKPLTPFENVRREARNRTQRGFIASPVAADLDRSDGGRMEVVLASMDRHVYALEHDGSRVPGFPVLVVDLSKVKSVDSRTHRVEFDNTKTGTKDIGEMNQGAIIDTPALGNIAGDARPEIVVGTNEEYVANEGNEGPTNISGNNAASVQAISQFGPRADQNLANANTRLFAIKPEGERDGNLMSGDWLVQGWPAKMALLQPHLLPVVGEGVTGAPAIAPLTCPSGGEGNKIGAFGNTGVAYVFNGDGTSCLGRQSGRDVSMDTDGTRGSTVDKPVFPAVGHPAFGDIGGGISLLGPVAGLTRALDVALPDERPVPPGLARAHERPPVPDRAVGGRHRRGRRRGARVRLLVPRPPGVQRLRGASRKVAQAHLGLDRRQPADRDLRHARQRPGRPARGGRLDAQRIPAGVPHRCAALPGRRPPARLVAALPPRPRELRRLLARRGRPRRGRRAEALRDRHHAAGGRRRPDVLEGGRLRARAVGPPADGRGVRGGRSHPGGHVAERARAPGGGRGNRAGRLAVALPDDPPGGRPGERRSRGVDLHPRGAPRHAAGARGRARGDRRLGVVRGPQRAALVDHLQAARAQAPPCRGAWALRRPRVPRPRGRGGHRLGPQARGQALPPSPGERAAGEADEVQPGRQAAGEGQGGQEDAQGRLVVHEGGQDSPRPLPAARDRRRPGRQPRAQGVAQERADAHCAPLSQPDGSEGGSARARA
jgi:hypothetical protein